MAAGLYRNSTPIVGETILTGRSFYISKNVLPGPDILKAIIECGGGSVVKKVPEVGWRSVCSLCPLLLSDARPGNHAVVTIIPFDMYSIFAVNVGGTVSWSKAKGSRSI